MNERLKSLISQASERVQAVKDEKEAQRRQAEQAKLKGYAEEFRQNVERALGSDVLDSIAPVVFDEASSEPSMAFKVDGRAFRLQSVGLPPALVQLEEDIPGLRTYPQFNLLTNPNAKDVFLDSLGKFLS